MKQVEFINLIQLLYRELPPNINIKKQYLNKHIKGLGYNLDDTFEVMQYYYLELEKAYNDEKSIFKGSVQRKNDYFSIVGDLPGKPFYCAYFGMELKGFKELKTLLFNSATFLTYKEQSKTFPDYLKHDKPEALAEALKKEFQGMNGKIFSFMFHVLYEKGNIIDYDFHKKALYKAMSLYFGKPVGADSSINRLLNRGMSINGINYYKDEHNKMINIINRILDSI